MPIFRSRELLDYRDRPAACRELLVTTPPTFATISSTIPYARSPCLFRVGPALALLWSELKQSTPMLIPLPMALDWAEHHKDEDKAWAGAELMERLLAKVGGYSNRNSPIVRRRRRLSRIQASDIDCDGARLRSFFAFSGPPMNSKERNSLTALQRETSTRCHMDCFGFFSHLARFVL